MSEESATRVPAVTIAATPVILFAALVSHPYIPGRLPNDAAIADAVAADPTRWGLSHLAAAVASAVVVLAFLALRGYLRRAGENRWSRRAVPFIVIGGTLYAVLPGMEFAPLAAAETGADIEAAQAALAPWFLPVLLSGSAVFALGVALFGAGVSRSGLLGPGASRVVVGALVVMAAARFVPFAAVQFYVQSAAALAAFWPLAYRIAVKGAPTREPATGRGVPAA